MLIISSCSKRQIIKTEIIEVEVIKFQPISDELTKDCKKITISDSNKKESDLINYLLDLISYNQDCTDRMRHIKNITKNPPN